MEKERSSFEYPQLLAREIPTAHELAPFELEKESSLSPEAAERTAKKMFECIELLEPLERDKFLLSLLWGRPNMVKRGIMEFAYLNMEEVIPGDYFDGSDVVLEKAWERFSEPLEELLTRLAEIDMGRMESMLNIILNSLNRSETGEPPRITLEELKPESLDRIGYRAKISIHGGLGGTLEELLVKRLEVDIKGHLLYDFLNEDFDPKETLVEDLLLQILIQNHFYNSMGYHPLNLISPVMRDDWRDEHKRVCEAILNGKVGPQERIGAEDRSIMDFLLKGEREQRLNKMEGWPVIGGVVRFFRGRGRQAIGDNS